MKYPKTRRKGINTISDQLGISRSPKKLTLKKRNTPKYKVPKTPKVSGKGWGG